MLEWWNSLNVLSQVYFCIALPSTLILLIQTILTFVGIGGDSDIDGDGIADVTNDVADDIPDSSEGVFGSDTDTDPDALSEGMASIKLLTFRGIVAFLVTFGWVGLAMDASGAPKWLSIPISLVCGFIMMLSLALVLRMVMKLRSDGNADNRNAVGVSGKVQLTIPPSRTGEGKVHVMLQGAYVERNAVTDEPDAIPTGAEVVVIGVSGETDLVVKRK